MRKKINGNLIGIKIQKEEETLNESEQYLQNAMKNKKFEYGILIRTHKDLVDHSVQDNIILIDDIDYFL